MEQRLNALLKLALKHKASDIHFTNYQNEMTIEMRINEKIYRVKNELGDQKILRYLQYLANLDVGNLLKPQTGQFEWIINDRCLSLRFALIHNSHMDNGVLRIMNESINEDDDDDISIFKFHNHFFEKIMNSQVGLYLNSGPTCSGKTTTLYKLLSSVKQKKIFTIEDPIEIHNENYIQIEINENINLGYDEAIKQVLRHDPDIIMIGEIRDEMTAKMAIRAANTGHLVIATIHSGSSKQAIERMKELGINESQLQNVLIGISNQRLFSKPNSMDKLVIYETMDKKEIDYYFENHHNSNNFINLKQGIEYATNKGYIKDDL